jgi:hypothetical protein
MLNYQLITYLLVKVQEPLRAVDVVKWSKAGDSTIYTHGVGPQLSSRGQEQPMGIWTTDEHL